MTAALQFDITDDVATPPRKSRRGSETRQRTEQVKMSFLPAERAVLEQIAADHGFTGNGAVQQLILLRLAEDLVSSP
jgi:hypothetical protein